jgi:hypothetical protein
MLERLKAATAAAQARETTAFAASQRAAEQARAERDDRIRRSVAGQVALARRISPYQASRYVGWANVLTSELPQTFAALQAGRTTEWRAMVVARETIWLSAEQRATVDAKLAPRLEALGDRRVEAEAKKLAYALDPAGFTERARNAENDRRVTVRPAPDTMARLTALLPVTQAVAAYAALQREADSVTAVGDCRGRGQIMADTLVERVTGQASAGDVPIEVNLVMSDETLLDPNSGEPAHLDGYGPIPAGVARRLALEAGDGTPTWLRRLFRRPGTGELAAMDTHRRLFTANQRRFLRLRDQDCRTPWCGAPIRHADHVTPAARGGRTTVSDGQGYCEACNYTKQAAGWRTRVVASRAGPPEIEVTTPTGHRYRSRPPDPPGRRRPLASPLEKAAQTRLRAA